MLGWARAAAAAGAVRQLGGAEAAGGAPPPAEGSAYSASKLAMVSFTSELERRLRPAKIPDSDPGASEIVRVRAVTVNPGAVNSEIWRGLPLLSWWARRGLGALCFLNPADAARYFPPQLLLDKNAGVARKEGRGVERDENLRTGCQTWLIHFIQW